MLELLKTYISFHEDGITYSNILDLLLIYKNQNSNKNFTECLSKLEKKIEASQLNGNLPELSYEDHNLMVTFLEEMQFTYTVEKRECITNLITNMLYEKKNGIFELYTYQVVFDQLKQMFDPEILLLKELYVKKDSLRVPTDNSILLILKTEHPLQEYSEYRAKKLENLAFLSPNTGLAADSESIAEYFYNKEYFDVFYNKTCSLLYE